MCQVTSLEAYNSVFKYDFICISETYPDLTISSDNNNLNIAWYNIIRANHPSSFCYKESLAEQTLSITDLTECLACKVCVGKKTGYVVVMYRSPSQIYILRISNIFNQF